ncbi:unnamed protein product [Bursaphelenchus xylophilus]|uniref:(pine wood nematode) hypothetical protein n=1 Tax=Bursaphelenchus xylophilus TaxID=6326 RepID=A0A1I7RS03_BURXY|nr:unnamed protein product [Bursaphelenchus xylophilus]CAG9123347.1 unnamed protein product [Bursaphelenchus xylophilus]
MANSTGQFNQLGNQLIFKLPTNLVNVNPMILIPQQPIYMPCNLSYFPQNLFMQIQQNNFMPMVQPQIQPPMFNLTQSKLQNEIITLPINDLATPIPQLPIEHFEDSDLTPPILEREHPIFDDQLPLLPDTSELLDTELEPPKLEPVNYLEPISLKPGTSQPSNIPVVLEPVLDTPLLKPQPLESEIFPSRLLPQAYCPEKSDDFAEILKPESDQAVLMEIRMDNQENAPELSREDSLMEMPILEDASNTSSSRDFNEMSLEKDVALSPSTVELDADASSSTITSEFTEIPTLCDVTKENKEIEMSNITTVEKLNESSSSGVSSADSSLWNDSATSTGMMPEVKPLTSVHNIAENVSQRRQRNGVSKKKGRATQIRKRRQIPSFSSNWRPLDEGYLCDLRLPTELQSKKRICYTAIRHMKERDEVIRIRDCVRVCSSEGLENIGKIFRLFFDEDSGNICAEVMWYYTQSQIPEDISVMENELLASKHIDVINVDSIEEHAFVLSYSEYCRFIAETRIDEMPPSRRPLESREIWPRGEEEYQRRIRLPHEDTPMDLIYFCRNVYSLKTRKLCFSILSRRSSLKTNRRLSKGHR